MNISVIIPIFNEEGSIPLLYDGLSEVLTRHYQSYEVIFIDDGSQDNSFSLLREITNRDNRVKVIKFRRNFGQSSAIAAGITHSCGKIVVLMDGDLQNDPNDIPSLVRLVEEEGYDIASGWRKRRRDNFLFVTLPSRIANRIISLVTGVKLNDYGCTLKAYRAEVLRRVPLYGEWHRFLPALASWMGARIIEKPVNHLPRRYGKSKYNIFKTYRVILDLITVKYFLNYYSSPMYLFGKIGLLLMLPGLIIGTYFTIKRFVFSADIGHKIPSLIFSAFSVLSGIIVIMFGLLAEIFIRLEHKENPDSSFVIEKIIQQPQNGSNRR